MKVLLVTIMQSISKLILPKLCADKNHVITDEDIRSIRISTDLPPFDEITTGAEAATQIIKEEKEEPSDRPATPWDTVE